MDLKRVSVDKAATCILLTNKNSENAEREDFMNILIALTIKKYFYIKNEKKDEN